MGLYPGFKSECIRRFPSAWNTQRDASRHVHHVFDGMCYMHMFSCDESDPSRDAMEQLVDFFSRTIDSACMGHTSCTKVLVFDVASRLPATKSEELAKRVSRHPPLESRGDISNGMMPTPFMSALEDRELRMEVCGELTKRLMALYAAREGEEFIAYGMIDGEVRLVQKDGSKAPTDRDGPIFEFGEADISMPYVIKELGASCATIHTVDTDLIAICMAALQRSESDVYVRLSHYDSAHRRRDFNEVSVRRLSEEVRIQLGMSPDTFVAVCVLQGTDFIERVVTRGSWKSLFDAVSKRRDATEGLVSVSERGVMVNTDLLIELLTLMRPKTMPVETEGTQKRRKVTLRDTCLDECFVFRMCWQLMYWRLGIHVGYEAMKECTKKGWAEVNASRAHRMQKRRSMSTVQHDGRQSHLGLFLDPSTPSR